MASVDDKETHVFDAAYCTVCGVSILNLAEVHACKGPTVDIAACLDCGMFVENDGTHKCVADKAAALALIARYGGIDGGHHKQWVLDQVVRVLVGEQYDAWVLERCAGEDGPDTYEWDEGIPP